MKFLLKSIILFYFIILVTETLAQGPPGTFSGSAAGTTITLNWSTTAAGTDGYFIRARRTPGGTFPTLPLATATHPLAAEDANLADGAGIHDVNAQATTSYNAFTGAVAGAQYDFEIYSYDDDGDTQSGSPTLTSVFTLATTPGTYPTPFNLAATGGATNIGLTFTKASKAPMDAHGYVVLRKSGSNPGVTGLTDGPAPTGTDFLGVVTDSTFTTFTDNTAAPGVSYTYALVPYRVGFNGATPIVGTYKYGTISTFSSATVPLVAAIAQQTGGVSNAVVASNINKALIGFSFTSNGTQTLTGATFTLNSPAATLGLTGFELWESNVATYDGVDGSVVATGANINVAAAVVTASGFSASTSKYYFLIADVSASAAAATFNVEFTSAATAGTISTAAPYFSHTGITITALTLALSPLTTGIAPSPLGAGSTGSITNNAILGFSISTNGTVDVSLIKITLPIDAAVALSTIFTNYSLIESPDNSFATTASHTVAIANADISTSGTGAGAFITLNPATDLHIDATTKYYFLVASVSNSVSTSVHVQPSLIASDVTLLPGTLTGGPVTGTNYSFQGSQTSTITLNGGTTAAIDYASYTDTGDNDIDNTTDSENIGTFRLRDVANDPDALGTTLTSLEILVTNAENLDRISLFVGDATSSTEATGTIVDQAVSGTGTVTINFTGLSILAADNGASNGDQNFTIRASFKTDVTDNAVIQVTINNATTLNNGSGLASFSATTGASANDIEVTATKLIFVDAMDVQFTGPINATPAPQAGSTFNATVAAVDANDNVDLDNTASVSLNITPSASVTFTGGSAVALAGGKHAYTLSINKPNTYSLGASDGAGLTDATSGNGNDVGVIITSLGVTIVKADLNACKVDATNIFTALPTMSFTESDNSDFSTGSGLTLLIILPEGWEFLTPSTSSPTPAYSGPNISYTASRNFTAAAFTGFIGTTIARFTYSVNNTDLQDALTISGLYVKNVNGDPSVDIFRSGTGLIQGADDTKSLGTLTTTVSPSATFKVEASPNQSPISANETNFSNGSQAIILNGEVPIGTPITAGVFSGASVVNNYIGAPVNAQRYTFNPNTLDPGNYPVTYTYANPTTGCVSSATKNFNVFASAIDGLASQYCVNNVTTQTLSVNPAFMPAGYNFVNFSMTFPNYKFMTNVVNLGSSLEITVPNHGLQTGNNVQMYIDGGFSVGYIYGTYTITTIDVNTFRIPVSTGGNWYGYGYVYLPQPGVTNVINFGSSLTITAPGHGLQNGAKIYHNINGLSVDGGVTPFIRGWYTVTGASANSYSISLFATATGSWISSGTEIRIFQYEISSFTPNMASTLNSRFGDANFYYVGFMVRPSACSGVGCVESVWNDQYVGINPLPLVSFSGLGTDYCVSNSSPVGLIGNQPDGSFASLPTFGLTDGPANTATFLASASGITTESPITVTYSYTDFNGCTNSVSRLTTVHALPVVKAGADQQICNGSNVVIGDAPTASVAYTVPTPIFSYQWDNAGSLDNATNSNPRANPIINTTYTVTVRDVYGCQNTDNTLVEVFTPATVTALLNDTICGSNNKILAVSGLIGGSATTASWTTPNGGGAFRQGVTANTTYGQANNYLPSANDVNVLRNVTITLTTDNPTGPCPAASGSLNLIINTAPVAAAGIDQTYCANDLMKLTGTITGSASSVTWSSNGLGSFSDPSSTITQYQPLASELISNPTIIVTMTSNDPDGPSGPCLPSSDFAILSIHARATIDAGADFAKCFDDPAITLTATKPIGSTASLYTWTGGGGAFTTPSALVSGYTPGPTDLGNIIALTITTNDPDGSGSTGPCLPESDVVLLTVNRDPAAPLVAQPPPICVNGISPSLQAFVSVGFDVKWYNDPALTPASNFGIAPTVPSGVNPSTDQVVTFYATQIEQSTGCEGPSSPVTVTVNPNPVGIFTATKFCFLDFTEFVDASTLTYNNGNSGFINQWSWNFADPTSSSNTATIQNPTHRYTSLASYNPTLTVTTTDGCSKTVDYLSQNSPNLLRIGPVPIADFNFKKICDKDSTDFFSDAGPANSEAVLIHAWSFGDPGSALFNTATAKNPSHEFTVYATYTTQLTITTALGCTDNITKQVPILPYLNNEDNFPYVQDFEDNPGNANPITPHGWVAQAVVSTPLHDGLSSWQLNTPNGSVINTAKSGVKAWFTRVDSLNTYFNAERSVLYGPCINVDSLDRPILSFDYWNNTDPGNDGVYLEIAIPDASGNINWTKFGDLSTGINWYNRGQILGLTQVGAGINAIGQAVGQIGWTGNTKTSENPAGWTNARYSLDDFAAINKLMIRFVFGSNPDNPAAIPLDGFALDNFKLSSRNRQVLAENFTNGLAPQMANNNAFVSFKQLLTNSEIIKIQYHTGLAGEDPLNKQNPADPSARAAFYGITNASTSIPRVYIDGYSEGDFVPNANWADTYFSKQTLVDAPFTITVGTAPTTEDGAMIITTSLVALENIPITKGKLIVHTAIIEKDVNGNEFVLRKMLPSAAGRMLTLPIAAGELVTLDPLPWSVQNPNIEGNDLSVIVFIQDQVTREIYQTAIDSIPANPPTGLITGTEDDEYVKHIQLYPNPANLEVNVNLPTAVTKPTPVEMFDTYGRVVYQDIFKAGQKSKKIVTSTFANGMYMLQIITPQGTKVIRKVMVKH